MSVQQLSVKLFAQDGPRLDQDALIPVFHRWIREARLGDKLLIDVADYRHVYGGPGVMIIADHAHYGFDEAVGGGPGLLFSRKRDAMGEAEAKLIEALREVLEAADALSQEPSLQGKVSFATDKLFVRVASRLAARNGDAAGELKTALEAAVARLYPGASVSIEADPDPARLPGFTVTADQQPSIADLLARL